MSEPSSTSRLRSSGDDSSAPTGTFRSPRASGGGGSPSLSSPAAMGRSRRSPYAEFFAIFKRFYLLFYNVAQFTGWTCLLLLIGKHFFVAHMTYQTLWYRIKEMLVIFQSMAFLEVMHAGFGLVPSSVVTTFIQIFSRILLSVIVVPNVPNTQTHWLFTSMVVSWCLVEIIRYSFYVLSMCTDFAKPPLNIARADRFKPPYFHTWLRYTAFWILYPTGGSSEALVCLLAVPYIRQHEPELFSLRMPNELNFAFDFATFLQVFAYSYVVGLPFMMYHMVRQRSSALAKARDAAKAKAH